MLLVRIKKEILLFAIIVFLALPSSAEFVDVPKGHSAAPAIKNLLQEGIITLPPSRKFDGKAPVTMYQMTVVLDQILDKTGKLGEIEARPLERFYVDVPPEHYADKAIRDLVKLGLFTISEHIIPGQRRFAGEAKLNRYIFFSLLATFIEKVENKKLPAALPNFGYSDVPTDHYAFVYIQKLIEVEILSGKGELKGDELLTRYEMAIYVAKVLDYLQKQVKKPEQMEKPKEEVVVGYIDVPEDHYARQEISELVEIGILEPGKDARFYGESLINRYYMVDFTTKIIEKIIVGEKGELELANYAYSYKDVPVRYFAYRPIQKLIGLGLIPAGNRKEFFYGDRKVNRYQMVTFIFSALEHILKDIITFKIADSSLAYGDVLPDHFAYETIQRLIWLGVLEGGKDRSFHGEESVDRYELCFFGVNLIKAIFLKLEERKLFYKKPHELKTLFNTEINASQIVNGKGSGEDLYDLYAYQSVTLSVDRTLNRRLSAYVSLYSKYYFGTATTDSSFYLDQAYVLANSPPFILQAGRTNLYQGFTPFGNSLYIDTSSDTILANYDHMLFNLDSVIGKLTYFGDITQDSNFGTISLNPKFPNFLDWLELSLGGSLITDLPDPTFSFTLPTRVVQAYGGLKANLLNLFILTAEMAKLDFSNPSVLSIIGTSDKEDTEASQYSVTFFAENYEYILSLGYQKIGDDYFISNLANPISFIGAGQNTESLLIKARYYPSPLQIVGLDLAYASQDEDYIKSGISGYYNLRIYNSAYLNLALTKIFDNSSAHQDELSASSSFSIFF